MTTLHAVHTDLLAEHGPAIDAVPVVRMLGDLGQSSTGIVLRMLQTEAGGTEALGSVLRHEAANRRFDSRVVPSVRRIFASGLSEWARRHQGQKVERERVPRDAQLEGELHELDLWTRRLGVEEHLDDPASEIVSFLDSEAAASEAMRALLTGSVRQAAVGRTAQGKLPAEAVRVAARRYLEACAAEQVRDARRALVWQTTPEAPAFVTLAAQLRELDAGLEALGVRPARLADLDVTLDASVPSLSCTAQGTRPRVSLVLTGHERGAMSFDPPAYRGHPLARALARFGLDAVHDRTHRLHAALLESVSVPQWRRLLEGLETTVAEADPDARRLVFRLTIDARGLPVLDAAEQRRSTRGAWSKGTRVAHEAQLRDDVSAQARLALIALHLVGRPTGSAAGEALLALVGEPNVVDGASSAPLTVRKIEPHFALEDEAGGTRPALALEDLRLSVEAAALQLSNSRCVVAVSAARGEVLVAPVSPTLAALVAAAVRVPSVVPAGEWTALLPTLERVASLVPVTLPPALESQVSPLPTALFLRITPSERATNVEVRARIPGGGSATAGHGSALVSSLDAETGLPVLRRRDLEAEAAAAAVLAREFGWPEGAIHTVLEGDEALLALLEQLHDRPELEVEWPGRGPSTRFLGRVSGSSLRVQIHTAAQWFGVEGDLEIDGQTLSIAELLKQIRAGRRYVSLGAGKYAALEASLRARLERMADAVFDAGDGLTVAPTAGDAIEALAEDSELVVDALWSTLRNRLAMGLLATVEVPEAVTATLRGYQREGFAWMARLASVEAGAVLADDMGLGKTVQALSLLVHRAAEGPAFVIAPTSLGDNWVKEAARFTPGLRMRLHRGPGRHEALASDPLVAGDVLVASYDIVALDSEALNALEFATLILDEAQAVKNPDAQRSRAVRGLRARARFALTGTPLENRLSELWSLFSIVHPGLLGHWEHFRARFAVPVEREGDGGQLAALSSLVRPFILRRTKEVVTPELPPRIEIIREVELSDRERALYDAERADALVRLANADETQRFQVLASLTRLRQLACDASLVVPEQQGPSAKLLALLELVEELEASGRKVLVFSQFVRLLERTATLLSERGTSFLMLDGSTPAAERARLVDRFQGGEATVFLLSLKAGGTGLNLTAADHVVHLDPWWNPAVEDQASDRAHRIGQDKSVSIVKLIAKDTLEQAVLSLHEKKRALGRGVLEGTEAVGAMSAAELVSLIRGEPAAAPDVPRRR